MAAIPGKLYVCDRAAICHNDGKRPEEFLQDGDKRADRYHEVSWTDSNGVQIHSMLCEECYDYWVEIQDRQARENADFMYKGLI